MRPFTDQILNWYFCASTTIQVKSKKKKKRNKQKKPPPTQNIKLFTQRYFFPTIHSAMLSGQCCAIKKC